MRFLPALGAAPPAPAPVQIIERKDATTRRASASPFYAFVGQPYQVDWDSERAVKQAYERVIWVMKAINARAGAAARLDVLINDGRGDDAQPIPDHHLPPLLNRRANPFESALFFRYRLHAQLDLSKKGVFVEVKENRAGDAIGLYLLNPAHTWPIPDPEHFVSNFLSRIPGGDQDEIPVYKKGNGGGVLWIRRPHPTDPYSSSTWLEAAGIDIDLDYWARLFNRTFMQNDGRPGGILAVKGDLDEEDADRMGARFSGGTGQAGRVSVLEADDVTYFDLATTPRDAQYVESRVLTKADILVAAGTGLSVIGDSSNRCVDDRTEALTKRGWLTGSQLTTDDSILAMDPADGRLKWSAVHEVYRNPVYSGPMYRLAHIDALVTPGHKWVVEPRTRAQKAAAGSDRFTRVKVEDLAAWDRVITMGDAESSVADPAFSTAFVELVGWAVTEGHYTPNAASRAARPKALAPYVRIRQNIGENADRIERCAKEAGANYNVYERDGRILLNIRGEVAAAILAVAPDRVLGIDFILALTAAQREHLLQTMIDADGCRQASTASWTFAQKDRAATEAFVFLATLCGYTTSIREREYDYTHRGTTARMSDWIAVVRRGRATSVQHGARTVEHYDGLVWCPRTEYGTFVARRGGKVFVTSNTYDNADQELENFWTITMLPELDLVASFYEELTEGGILDDSEVVEHDLSKIPALQRHKRSAEAQGQSEVDKGLRTIDEYREATGKEPMNQPGSRVLWVPAGRVPVGDPEDVAVLTGQAPAAAVGQPPTEAAPDDGAAPEDALTPEPGRPRLSVVPGRAGAERQWGSGYDGQVIPGDEAEGKARPKADGGDDPADLAEARRHADKLRAAHGKRIADALEEVWRRQEAVVVSRLGGAKARRHTRHWQGGGKHEKKALDPVYVVDRAKWAAEAAKAVTVAVSKAVAAGAEDVVERLGGGGKPPDAKAKDARRLTAAIIRIISEGFDTRSGRLQDVIADADDAGLPLDDILERVREAFLARDTWAEATSTAVVGALNGGAMLGAVHVGATQKRWLATNDQRTRPSHRKAEGQVVEVGKPFKVGEGLLMFPGDPTGPIEEWRNCRCTLLFQLEERSERDFDAELDEDLAELDRVEAGEKHLLGLHDQSSHGRRGSAAALTRRPWGFTFNVRTRIYPKKGIAVARPGTSGFIPYDQWVKDGQGLLDAYLEKYEARFEADPTLHLGGWRTDDHNEFVLDLTDVIADRDEGIRLGAERDQESVYDLATGETIPTGGTGGRGPEPEADAGEGKRHDGGVPRSPADRRPGSAEGVRAGDVAGVAAGDGGGGRGGSGGGGDPGDLAEKVRRVRTPEGSRYYGQPIGSPIVGRVIPNSAPQWSLADAISRIPRERNAPGALGAGPDGDDYSAYPYATIPDGAGAPRRGRQVVMVISRPGEDGQVEVLDYQARRFLTDPDGLQPGDPENEPDPFPLARVPDDRPPTRRDRHGLPTRPDVAVELNAEAYEADANLTDQQRTALNLWTGSSHGMIVGGYQPRGPTTRVAQDFAAALEVLPTHDGLSYRAIEMTGPQLDQLAPDVVLEWQRPVSTSLEPSSGLSRHLGNVVFEIDSSRGRPVWPFAAPMDPGESTGEQVEVEVVLPPGSYRIDTVERGVRWPDPDKRIFGYASEEDAWREVTLVRLTDVTPAPTPKEPAGPSARMPTAGELRSVFTFDGEPPFYTEVTAVNQGPEGVSVYGHVLADLDDGGGDRLVGDFARTFYPAGRSVRHELLRLDQDAQGLGFASAFNDHAERWYAAWGYDKITLTAGLEWGGYVWAKAGYQFRNGVIDPDVVDALDEVAQRGNYTSPLDAHGRGGGFFTEDDPAVAAEARALRDRIKPKRIRPTLPPIWFAGDGADAVTPADFLAVGRGSLNDEGLSIGAELLRIWGWQGEKDVVPATEEKALPGTVRMLLTVEPAAAAREGKVRRVRTTQGAQHFGQPIGSIIVEDVVPDAPRVAVPKAPPAVERVDEEGDPQVDAARIELTRRYRDTPAPDQHWPSEATGDGAKARASIPTVTELIDTGLTPDAAAKEWQRLYHNARFRFRRARLKAAKKGEAAKAADGIDFTKKNGPDPAPGAAVDQYGAIRLPGKGTAGRYTPGQFEALAKLGVRLHLRGKWSGAETGYTSLDGNTFDAAGIVVGRPFNPDSHNGPPSLVPTHWEVGASENLGAYHFLAITDVWLAAADLERVDPDLEAVVAGLDARIRGDFAAKKPTALYTLTSEEATALAATGQNSGPGQVRPGTRWFTPMTDMADGDRIPVVNLVIERRRIEAGTAVKAGGKLWLVEHSPTATHGEVDAEIKLMRDAWAKVGITIPPEFDVLQRGIAWLKGPNPADAGMAKPGQTVTSMATGGHGSTVFWNYEPKAGTLAHEFGHNLDSQVEHTLSPHGMALSTKGIEGLRPTVPGAISWRDALDEDQQVRPAWSGVGTPKFIETRRAETNHPITPQLEAVTSYGATHHVEDFAESTRLYLKDRREEKLGYLERDLSTGPAKGIDVRFADIWPGRARFFDALFGVKPTPLPVFTEFQRTRMATATELVKTRALEDQPEPSIGELQRTFGLREDDARTARVQGLDAAERHELMAKAKADAAEAATAATAAQEKADAEAAATLTAAGFTEASLPADTLKRIRKRKSAVKWQAKQEKVTKVSPKLVSGSGFTAAQLDALDGKRVEITGTFTEWSEESIRGDILGREDGSSGGYHILALKNAVFAESDEPIPTPDGIVKVTVPYQAGISVIEPGKTPVEAQQIADAYEDAAIADMLGKLAAGIPLDTPTAKPEVDEPTDVTRTSPYRRKTRLAAGRWLSAAGKTTHPKAKFGYGDAEKAKANIAASLAERLNTEAGWEEFRQYLDAMRKLSIDPNVGSPYVAVDLPAAYALVPETDRQAILDKEMSLRVRTWAQTAGDSHAWALLMQRAVKAEFGVEGDWGTRIKSAVPATSSGGQANKTLEFVEAAWPGAEKWMRTVARAMYQQTQDELKAAGITRVSLYRGVKSMPPPWNAGGTFEDVPQQPVNSWTTRLATAKTFAGYSSYGVGWVLVAEFPAERILGSARTGFGCLNELEFTVLNTPGPTDVYSAENKDMVAIPS